MIADVWSKRDFVVRGVTLVGIILFAVAQYIDSVILTVTGLVVLLVALGILIGWRVARGPSPRRDIGPRVYPEWRSNRQALWRTTSARPDAPACRDTLQGDGAQVMRETLGGSPVHRVFMEKPMNGNAIRRNRLERAAGMVAALLAVTGASYLWRLSQAWGPTVVLAVYLLSFFLLIGAALVIFRRVVRRAYQLQGRLTPLFFFLQILLWGIYFAFPCIYNPYDWAWSSPSGGAGTPLLTIVGWACVGLGLVALALAMAWLGWPRSSGQGSKKLELSGPYRLTRNPQLMAGVLLIAGYVVLWPSWYALGWLVLYAPMAHTMVLAEEGYLRAIHGETYEEYCRRVPRYVGLPRRS